jgi:hypothetical protein
LNYTTRTFMVQSEILTYIQYFMEHLYKLLVLTCNLLTRAEYFDVMVDVVSIYQEIKDGIQNASRITGINELFRLAKLENDSMVRQRDLTWNTLQHSILLMYRELAEYNTQATITKCYA